MGPLSCAPRRGGQLDPVAMPAFPARASMNGREGGDAVRPCEYPRARPGGDARFLHCAARRARRLAAGLCLSRLLALSRRAAGHPPAGQAAIERGIRRRVGGSPAFVTDEDPEMKRAQLRALGMVFAET